MMTKRFQKIFLISIPLFIAHGLEEYFTGFYDIDGFSRFVFGPLNSMPTPQATFLLFQILLWLFLLTSFLLLVGGKWKLRLMFVLGLVFLFEIHHLVKAIYWQRYYPGVITEIPFLIVGYFFWKELIKNLRSKDKTEPDS